MNAPEVMRIIHVMTWDVSPRRLRALRDFCPRLFCNVYVAYEGIANKTCRASFTLKMDHHFLSRWRSIRGSQLGIRRREIWPARLASAYAVDVLRYRPDVGIWK